MNWTPPALLFAILANAVVVQSGRSQTGTDQQQNAKPVSPPNDGQNLSLQPAREFLQKGMLTDAERETRAYLTQNLNSANGHFLLGYILFKQGKAQASLAEYTEGAKFHDPEPSDLKIVALNYVLLNDYTDADHWLTRSVTADPKDSESW